jgi:tetratricopeptide (TPR) repeat protein
VPQTDFAIDDGISKRPLRVFLCHSNSDKAPVRELYDKLRAASVDAWLDEMNLKGGQDWDLEIRRAVRTSDVVIVCLSSGSVTKEGYVQKEIKQALDVADEKPDGTIYIVPVRLDECNVPERLRRWHWIDYFLDGGFEQLLTALSERAIHLRVQLNTLKRKAASPAAVVLTNHGQHLHAHRHSWIIGSSVLITLLVGASIYELSALSEQSPGQLLALAYKGSRPFELRLSGAPYAPVTLRRYDERDDMDSSFALPSLLAAQAQIAKELKSRPRDPELGRLRADAELLAHHSNTAVHVLEECIQSHPQSGKVLADLGVAHAVRGDLQGKVEEYQAALEDLNLAIKITPNALEPPFNRAVVLERLQLFDSAAEQWRTYLHLDSSSQWSEEAHARLSALKEKVKFH